MRPGMHTGACLKGGIACFYDARVQAFPQSQGLGGQEKTGERRGNGTSWLDKVRALRQLKPVGAYGRCRGGEGRRACRVRQGVRTGRPCSAQRLGWRALRRTY